MKRLRHLLFADVLNVLRHSWPHVNSTIYFRGHNNKLNIFYCSFLFKFLNINNKYVSYLYYRICTTYSYHVGSNFVTHTTASATLIQFSFSLCNRYNSSHKKQFCNKRRHVNKYFILLFPIKNILPLGDPTRGSNYPIW